MGVFGGKKGPKPEEAYGAVKTSNIATLKGLLEKNCDPTAYKDAMTGDTALHLATNKGRGDMVLLILGHGTGVNIQNKLGQTALHCASGYGAVPLVKLLLEKGADKELADLEGQKAIDMARSYGQGDVATLLA